MSLQLYTTHDQSLTLYNSALDETYHSRNGAMEEALHVFINAGLQPAMSRHGQVHLLEIGLGTGLNAILTLQYTALHHCQCVYEALETYPLPAALIAQLNYTSFIPAEIHNYYHQINLADWNVPVNITPSFIIHKHLESIHSFNSTQQYNLIYFDAFGPDKQPDMWTPAVFNHLFNLMVPGGILVTYSAKGEVRRTLQASGFIVERLPGPPRKRHMLRATKPIV